jgi:hypothetical protein
MKNFPKLYSPFVREQTKKGYLVTQEIDEDCLWFLEKGVMAVDKIDGTNVGIKIENGEIKRIFNRDTEKFIFNINQSKWEGACMEGLAKAIQRGWLKGMEDGDYYGELIGEIFNGNRHKLQGHLFVPFKYLLNHCFWKSWVEDRYPKDFDTISEWFEDLPSLFNQRMKLPDIKAEGLVFYHKDGRMCKLRRDMYSWYKENNK